jgi:hypothetical protein
MKTTNRIFTAIAAAILLLSTITITAQDDTAKGPQYVVMTTLHWNMDNNDFDMDEWKATEKEYMDKVTKKNEHIMSAGFYLHNITPDNTELVYVQSFPNWNAIDLASKRNGELAREAWADKDARKAFFDKQSAYYATMHSDEIYATMPNAKPISDVNDGNIVYVRTSQFNFPKDGTNAEFNETFKEYVENITHKNEFIKGYYPMEHAYGADKRDFLEAYFLNSLTDMDKMFEKNGELYNAHWKDEAARKEMNEKGGKYFTGVHGDAVYSVVPELRK